MRLWWDADDNSVWVSVLDTRSGDALRIEVRAGQDPLDVFQHPFAYSPREHVEATGAYAF